MVNRHRHQTGRAAALTAFTALFSVAALAAEPDATAPVPAVVETATPATNATATIERLDDLTRAVLRLHTESLAKREQIIAADPKLKALQDEIRLKQSQLETLVRENEEFAALTRRLNQLRREQREVREGLLELNRKQAIATRAPRP